MNVPLDLLPSAILKVLMMSVWCSSVNSYKTISFLHPVQHHMLIATPHINHGQLSQSSDRICIHRERNWANAPADGWSSNKGRSFLWPITEACLECWWLVMSVGLCSRQRVCWDRGCAGTTAVQNVLRFPKKPDRTCRKCLSTIEPDTTYAEHLVVCQSLPCQSADCLAQAVDDSLFIFPNILANITFVRANICLVNVHPLLVYSFEPPYYLCIV